MSLSKALALGIGAVAGISYNNHGYILIYIFCFYLVGAGIYYLSRDTSELKFNPKVHTLKKLH
jgi:hypothetical protein